MTRLQEIEEIIKTHPEIPQVAIEDVRYRVNCWMQSEWATPDDQYLMAQIRYLNRIIDANIE